MQESQFKGVTVSIVRYISDDPQPGIVEAQLVDAHGRLWSFIDKTAIFTRHSIGPESTYPQLGHLAGEIVSHRIGDDGRELVVFDIKCPWDVEAHDGSQQFEVACGAIVEF